MYLRGVWGVDERRVKQAESGELIRFTWRILDPDKAKLLNDKKVQSMLIDPQAGVQLIVSAMEKVGQLRQSSTRRQANPTGWHSQTVVPVKRDRVTIVIGQFKAEGSIVK